MIDFGLPKVGGSHLWDQWLSICEHWNCKGPALSAECSEFYGAWWEGSTERVSGLTDVTAGPLSIIYQRSLESGDIPADGKWANVFPIYKNSVGENPGNYRPFSLTSVPERLWRRSYRVLLKGFQRIMQLSGMVNRFAKGKSCLTNLISFYDKVTHLIVEGKMVGVVFWILVRLLILCLIASSLTSCPAVRWTGTRYAEWRTDWSAGLKGL